VEKKKEIILREKITISLLFYVVLSNRHSVERAYEMLMCQRSMSDVTKILFRFAPCGQEDSYTVVWWHFELRDCWIIHPVWSDHVRNMSCLDLIAVGIRYVILIWSISKMIDIYREKEKIKESKQKYCYYIIII